MTLPSAASRALATLLVVLMLPGCSSWRPMAGSPDPTLIPPRERSVLVELRDGSRFELRDPSLVEDSLLVGTRLLRRFDPDVATVGREEPRRIATAELIGIETQQKDPVKTGILVAVVGLGFAALVIALGNAFGKGLGESLDKLSAQDRSAPAPPVR